MNHNLQSALERLPSEKDVTGAVVILSGGMDSTTSLVLAVRKYGLDKVHAITFQYGQKQIVETSLAKSTCEELGVIHKVFDLDFLREINIGFSANVDKGIEMPTIADVLGDPAPKTYVANRNMIMLSIAASYAEARGFNKIICGFQSNDTYGYHDTTPIFTKKINAVLSENRKIVIEVIAPFNDLTKEAEIKAIMELTGNVDVFKKTITCYNPDEKGRSCGVCPSCAERLNAFKRAGVADPIVYVEK